MGLKGDIKAIPDSAYEKVKSHKAAVTGAVVGGALTLGNPIGIAAGGALGEAAAKFKTNLQKSLEAFKESPELTPEIAVQKIKEPSFFGKAMEIFPKGLAEAATGKRPIGRKERLAQTAAKYEVDFARAVHHISKLAPEEQNEVRAQILADGKVAGPEAAAAHYTLLKLDVEHQQTIVAAEQEKQKQLTAETHKKRQEAEDYKKHQTPELQAERLKHESRIQAYEAFLAKVKSAKNPAEVAQAVQDAKDQISGGAEQGQYQDLNRDAQFLKVFSDRFHPARVDALNRNPALAENQLQAFEGYLVKKNAEVSARTAALKKENKELIAQLQTGKETIDHAKVEAGMPDEWKEAKRKQDEAKAALTQLTHPTAPNQARTTRILLRNEAANNQTLGDYQAEYNRVSASLVARASRAKIEAEIDRTKGREFRERTESSRKENAAIQAVRADLAHGSNTEALTYLKSLTSAQQTEMDKHKAKKAELEKQNTTRKPLTDDEVAQEIGGEFLELNRRSKELATALDFVKNRSAHIGPAGDYRRIAGQIRSFAAIENRPLVARMGEVVIKRGAKTSALDREMINYLDQSEAYLVNSFQGRTQFGKERSLRNSAKELALKEDSPLQKGLNASKERLDALKGDPEKELEKIEKEKAASAQKLQAAKEGQATLENPLQNITKYIEGVYGKDFLARVEGRMEQIATVREDLTQLDAAAAQLAGESQEQKEARAHDLIKKRQSALGNLEHASDTSLRGFVRDLRSAGIDIDEDDEEEAIAQMRKVGTQHGSRSLFGIFAALLNSLNGLQPQNA